MNITVLQENRRQAREYADNKKILIDGLKGKLLSLQDENEKSIRLKANLERKIDLLDDVLEVSTFEATKKQIISIDRDLFNLSALIENTERTFEKEAASLQELQERISGIERKIRLAIADREAGVAREAAFVVNRALEAAKLAGSFTTYEEFFRHIFPVNKEDQAAMMREFEAQAK